MAITYTQTISESIWNLTENNQILQFTSDSLETPLYCDFEITDGFSARIYPNTSGVFWINLKEYISSLVNDYADDLDFTSIDELDIDTFVYDWSKVFLNEDIDITITFDDDSTETDTITPFFILGKEDVIPYKLGKTIQSLSQTILSPLKKNTANTFYLRYFEGYPFDFALTRNIPSADTTQTITNNTNAITSPDIELPYDVNRVVICNGDTSVTLEDYLPLTNGYNNLEFQNSMFIELWKEETTCGVYVKWLNQYGGYNYWLFNEQHQEVLNHASKGIINNDFTSLDNTTSPFKSLGRNSESEMVVRSEHLNQNDIDLLSGITQSPKVYLFTGVIYSAADDNDWVEVNVKNSNILLRDFKGNIPDVELTLELPKNYSISL